MMKYELTAGKELRIAISGKSGCGNTTVSKFLSEKLSIGMINFTFRQLAAEQNLTLAEILQRAKTDDSFDRAVDTRQVELARRTSCVLGSRLAVWMLKEADFKVYLLADEDVRAKRIQNREGGSLEDIKSFTQMRDAEDSRRYKTLYNINNNEFQFCDIIVNTAEYNPEQIVELILQKLAEKKFITAISD